MPGSLADRLRRTTHLAGAVVRSTLGRPAAPIKLNLCLTYWCQYRCKTCNIWRRRPTDELTLEEIALLIARNPDVNWVDLTGGEIFLRPDIDEIFAAVADGWNRLAILHFPTNGFLTDRIISSVERLAGRLRARLIVTVSLDGDEELNDRVRGVTGGFRRQIETFKALRRIPGVTTALGMTLSSYTAGAFERTFDACAREVSDLAPADLHLNVAQTSSHYYANSDTLPALPPELARHDLARYRARLGMPLRPSQALEHIYLANLDRYLQTGITPMPCHALRASCFIDPWGAVYPCITYERPVGQLRDTGMQLAPIWNSATTENLQREIWRGNCPQCWTACEAYQSILGNTLVFRRRSGATRPAGAPAARPTRAPAADPATSGEAL